MLFDGVSKVFLQVALPSMTCHLPLMLCLLNVGSSSIKLNAWLNFINVLSNCTVSAIPSILKVQRLFKFRHLYLPSVHSFSLCTLPLNSLCYSCEWCICLLTSLGTAFCQHVTILLQLHHYILQPYNLHLHNWCLYNLCSCSQNLLANY